MDFRALIVGGYLILAFTAQQQGIEGTARLVSGNHMPSPSVRPGQDNPPDSLRRSPADNLRASDSGARSGSVRPAPGRPVLGRPVLGRPTSGQPISGRPTAATICVFLLTNPSQVTPTAKAGLYRSIQTQLVRQADTDDSGHFRILLPPGTYSIFTKKGSLFYATRRDENNNIAPVKVLPGKMTRVECSVESDHTAVY
jgi:hypothetical protein